MSKLKNRIATSVLLAVSLGWAHAQFPSGEFENQWRLNWQDPAFVSSFIESYEPLKDVEPQFDNKSEINTVRDLRELFQANPRAAAARLQQEIDADSSAPYLYLLATLYLTDGAIDQAATYYEKAIEKYPNYRRAHKNLALVYLQNQEFEKALNHIHKAIELGEKDGRLYGLMGYIYLNKGNAFAAENAYREAVMAQPENMNWKLGLAQALLQMEHYREASALAQSLIELDPNKAEFWLLQVNCYLGMEMPERAIANLEMLRRMGSMSPESLKLLGDIYMNEEMRGQAVNIYSELMEKDTGGRYLDASIRLGRILTDLQQYDQALAMLDTIESNYETASSDDQLSILNLKARVARATGDRVLAKDTLSEVLEQDPLNGDALLELASVHAEDGETIEAYDLYGRAQKTKGYEARALLKHAQLLVKEKQYKDAVPLLKQSLTYNDDPRVVRFLESVESAARSQ